ERLTSEQNQGEKRKQLGNEKMAKEWKIEEIMNVLELNKAWHAAKKHIKEAQICSKEYYAFTIKATTLHNALKKVNSVYRYCKKLLIPLSYEECTSQINKELEYVRLETEHKISTVSAISWYTGKKTRLEQQINELRKVLHKAKEVENQKEKRDRIQLHVIRKRDKFTDNTKGMIKSVLKQKVAPVTLNNLKQKDSIITDVRRIKKEVEENFLKWTDTN
ncbi:36687_t:CDS:2, partial [Gigaspora margarita]